MKKFVNMVIAVGERGEIGYNQGLPWRLPDELRCFKETTIRGQNPTLIMGAKTAWSLERPLTNRINRVVTRSGNVPEGFQIYGSLEAAINDTGAEDAIYVIGGKQVYEEALQKGLIDRIYLTQIQHVFPDADTYIDMRLIHDQFTRSNAPPLFVSTPDAELPWVQYVYDRIPSAETE